MSLEADSHGPLVERIYDIVVAPERLEALIDTWAQRIAAHQASAAGLQLLGGNELLPHVERAEFVLKSVADATNLAPDPSAQHWVSAARGAAAVMTRTGQIMAANSAAITQLRLTPGARFETIALEPEDRASLWAEIVREPKDKQPRILRFRRHNRTEPIIMRLVNAVGGDRNQVGIVTTIVSWPNGLSPLVQSTFALTGAETGVLKHLTLGRSVNEIAKETKRSVETIRSHVGALLTKTETRSQIELVRMTLGLLDVIDEEPTELAAAAKVFVSDNGNVYHTLPLSDGRKIDYLIIGNPRGRSFVLMPDGIGTTRMPPRDERAIFQRGLRMVVPIRAGFGRSSPIPTGRHVYDVAADDHIALLDHLGIAHAPFVTLCDDFRMAVEIDARKPGRIAAIIGCGAALPISKPEHLARMTKFSRFVKANARYAPRAMPYVAQAFFGLVRHLGPKKFLQTVMKDSPSDLSAIEDDEVMNAIVRGSEIALSPGFTAHAAWATEAIANFSTDWTETLRACRIPLTLFVGDDDPFSPFETAQDFAAEMPHIRLVHLPKTGQIMFAHSARLFDLVEAALADDGFGKNPS